jgi:hypothetical protein
MYVELFDYASNIKVKSLAITFLGIQDEFEFGMIALYEALNNYLRKKNFIKLNKIFISALDKEALIVFKDYLDNGYDKSILDLVIKSVENKGDFITSQKQDFKEMFTKKDENRISIGSNENIETFCSNCKSRDHLINFSNIENQTFFKECRESKIRLYGVNSPKKCGPCSIINELVQIYFTHFDTNKLKTHICLKCCIQAFVNSLKNLYCSCCLRDVQGKLNVNKFCSLHLVCDKCFSMPLAFVPATCYFCKFYEFYEKLVENNLRTDKLTSNHDKLNCARDFCHLDFSEENIQVTKLAACGHGTCKKTNVIGICAYCSIFKILDMMKKHYRINVNKIDSLKIEEDLKKSRETINKQSFQSYYENLQNEFKDNLGKKLELISDDEEEEDECKEVLTDDNDDDNDDDNNDDNDNDNDDEIDYEDCDENDDEDGNQDDDEDGNQDYDEDGNQDDDEDGNQDDDDDEEINRKENIPQIKMYERKNEWQNYVEGGTMEIKHLNESLSGFDCNTIQIGFFVPNGIQKVKKKHKI